MLESHCCKCVALNMYVSVSLAPMCRCGCHIICSAQHLDWMCFCCKYQSQRWCTRSHDYFKGEEPVVRHVAFWLAVFTPWITRKCDWQQSCCNTDYSGWEVQLVQIFHCCCSHSWDFFFDIFIWTSVKLSKTQVTFWWNTSRWCGNITIVLHKTKVNVLNPATIVFSPRITQM